MSDPMLMTAPEVARLCRVHRVTVYRWARDGQLAVLSLPGRRVLFRREDVEAFIETGMARDDAPGPEAAAS